MVEVRPHPATDDFGVPEVNGSRQGKSCRRAEGGGGPQDRADVSRVLDGVQDEQPQGRSVAEGRSSAGSGTAPIARIPAATPSRRRWRTRRRRPLRRRCRARRSCGQEGGAAGRLGQLRAAEHAREWRATSRSSSSTRPDPFGDEQALALPGFSALQIAGEGEQFHASGICLAFAPRASFSQADGITNYETIRCGRGNGRDGWGCRRRAESRSSRKCSSAPSSPSRSTRSCRSSRTRRSTAT